MLRGPLIRRAGQAWRSAASGAARLEGGSCAATVGVDAGVTNGAGLSGAARGWWGTAAADASSWRGFASGSASIPDYAKREHALDDGPEPYSVTGKVQPGSDNTEARSDGGYTVKDKDVFAVVEVGPHQFKVATNDIIMVEKLRGVAPNDVVSLKRVLMLGSAGETVIGRPFVPGEVVAACEEQFQDAKVIIFKKKRRKNYRRTNGHRQRLTALRILDITGIEEAAPAAAA